MRKTFVHAAALTLAASAVLALQPAGAQPATTHTPVQPVAQSSGGSAASSSTTTTKTTTTSTGPATGAAMTPTTTPGTFRATVWYQVGDAQKKLLELANAVPADKFGWRPAPGVRTVGEVYMHVASANYFFPTLWGGTAAPGVDPRTFEKDGADKAKVIATLKASFEFVHQAIDAMPEDVLHKEITVFGRKATPADLVEVVATHAHEHLGQSIAYARSIGVTPPWSAAQAD